MMQHFFFGGVSGLSIAEFQTQSNQAASNLQPESAESHGLSGSGLRRFPQSLGTCGHSELDPAAGTGGVGPQDFAAPNGRG